MKIRGRFTGAVAATMRQQFACSAFRSRTSILFRVIAICRRFPRKRRARTSAGVACVTARLFLAKTTAAYTSPGESEADTTARSPGTCDPKMSWHAYQRTALSSSEGKQAMTKLIASLALLFLIGGSATDARAAGSWCAFYDASTYNCGFHSFEQCRETVLVAGGWCRPNFFEDRPGGQRNRAR